MIGQKLKDYDITGTLGSGGMGTVYLAKDARLARTVAVKVLPSEFARDDARRRRFLQEARAASALNHPNVAHIYDIGEHDGVSFIVMEYVAGQSLRERLDQGRLDAESAMQIATQLCDALAEAHRRGVVHRDIKPANIMLTERGLVKVLDFGLAKFERSIGSATEAQDAETQAVTQPGVMIGTPLYMSPEQVRGTRVGRATDLFSFGVVLYEMLTGRLPFRGRTPIDTIDQILNATPLPVRDLDPDVDARAQAIVDRCLAKAPEDRFESADDLLRELRAARERRGESTEPAAHRAWSAGERRARRTEALAAVASVAVLPFDNGTNDPDTEYLCEGVAESLIHSLTRVSDLRVISSRSSFALRDERDPSAIGEILGVDALVFGRLTLRGNDLVVSAELVNVSDNRQLWGERYQRCADDITVIEQDVVANIARELSNELSGDVAVASEPARPVDAHAYRLYLQGRQLLIGTAAEMKKAEESLVQATELDPEYALPHAALVEAYIIQSFHNIRDQKDALRRARAALSEALRIDPQLPEAHTADGMIRFMYDWDWIEADRAFRRAIELGPGKDVPYLEYAEFLAAVGRLDESIETAARARELDPLSPAPTHLVAYGYLAQGRYDEAVAEFEQALAKHPNWTWGHIKISRALAFLGSFDEALNHVIQAEAQLEGRGTPLARSWLAAVRAMVGDEPRAREMLAALEVSPDTYVDPVSIGFIYAGLGDKERVLECMERAYRERSPLCPHMGIMPHLLAGLDLASEPRFQAIYERMAYPDWGAV